MLIFGTLEAYRVKRNSLITGSCSNTESWVYNSLRQNC